MSQLRDSKCVFVVAQGRSGSTLLLRLLNTIEGYNICGENCGAIAQLSTFYQALLMTLKKTPQTQGRLLKYDELFTLDKPESDYSGFEWYNIYSFKSIQGKLRELIIEMYNPERKFRVWGFKEIRFGTKASNGIPHHDMALYELSSYNLFKLELDFLKELFSNTKFIFNTRKIKDLVKSEWWAEQPNKSQAVLKEQEYFFAEYSNHNPNFCYCLTYDDLVHNTEALQGMYQFLEEPFDIDKYKVVLSRS